MSRLIKLLDNENIEIVEYLKANACFQTNKYPSDELVCVIRETFNPFVLFHEKLCLEEEIERLNKDYGDMTILFAKEREETKRLNNKIKEIQKINLVDHKYASEMEDKYITTNNIINELEKYLWEERYNHQGEYVYTGKRKVEEVYTMILDKIKELKGDSSNE